MTVRVIGAGFGRTGTLSLKRALETLGAGPCYHMEEVVKNPHHIPIWASAHRGEAVDWDALFEGYRASVDWPSCNLWREQLAHWPDAKVVLSLRDPGAWYESVMNTIHPASSSLVDLEDDGLRTFGRWVTDIVWDGVFDGRMHDRDHVIARFEAHNRSVIEGVPADRLLVYRPGDGWEPLCAFLGVDVPDEDYPHVNTTEQFLDGGLGST
jgi:hypothetical protein